MKNECRIQSGEVEFELCFSFSPSEPLTPETEKLEAKTEYASALEKSHYLEILIKRSDVDKVRFHEIHVAGLRSEICFELPFEDFNNIRGVLSIRQNKTDGTHFVWGNIHCGPKLEKNYQGGLLTIR